MAAEEEAFLNDSYTDDPEVVPPLDGSFLDVSLEEVVNSEAFSCDICGRSYKTKHHLRRHLKKHSSEETHECTRCTQYFPSQEALDEHKKNKHVKRHLCVACGKSFMTKSNLTSHTEGMHPDAEDAKKSHVMSCPFKDCKKVFHQKERYQDHMNIHTGIKPYSCLQCGREFHNRYYKADHERICLGLTQIKCDVCNKILCDKSSLKRHKDTQHSGKRFSCVCGKSFAYGTSLSKHKKERNH